MPTRHLRPLTSGQPSQTAQYDGHTVCWGHRPAQSCVVRMGSTPSVQLPGSARNVASFFPYSRAEGGLQGALDPKNGTSFGSNAISPDFSV